MSFVEAIQSVVVRNYVNFQGRARRSEYWWFFLANCILSGILAALARSIGFFGFLSGIVSLALLLPGLGVCVRRLHDIGKRGWWIFISLVPIVGVILLIVWLAKDSEPGSNEYGPNPKE